MQLRLFPAARPLVERFGSDFFKRVPRRPGVYLMSGEPHRLLYIGKPCACCSVRPPDLIISDLSRPGLDALEFTRRVRHWRPQVPVLIISGALAASETLQAAAWAAGASACLTKPLTAETILRLVRRHLQPRGRLPGPRSSPSRWPLSVRRSRPRSSTDSF